MSAPSGRQLLRLGEWHPECNAYCRGETHAELVWSHQEGVWSESERVAVLRHELGLIFGAEYLADRLAPEAPPPDDTGTTVQSTMVNGRVETVRTEPLEADPDTGASRLVFFRVPGWEARRECEATHG